MRLRQQVLLLGVVGAAALVAWQFAGPFGSQTAAEPRRAPPPVPVVVEAAYTGTVEQVVEAIGTTRANEAVVITPKVAGIVRSINFDSGAEVPAGAVVASLESAELEAELRSAEAELLNAEQLLARAETLARSNNVAQARVDELRAGLAASRAKVAAAAARLAEANIVAPFAGTLGIRRVSPGSLVSPGTPIFTLDDLSVIKLDFALPETLLSSIRPGMALDVTSDAFPDREFRGTVLTIDSRVDPVTRAVATVAEIANPDRALRPGMFMTVAVIMARDEQATLVPEEALVPQGEQQFVYVVEGDAAARRPIEIGTRMPGAVEVVSGLEPGEMVVVRGVQRLRDGAPVAIVPQDGDPARGPGA